MRVVTPVPLIIPITPIFLAMQPTQAQTSNTKAKVCQKYHQKAWAAESGALAARKSQHCVPKCAME